jgi:hypothetical protein
MQLASRLLDRQGVGVDRWPPKWATNLRLPSIAPSRSAWASRPGLGVEAGD